MIRIESSAFRRTAFVAGALLTFVLCFGSPVRAQKMLSSSAWRSVTQFTAIPKHTKVRVRVTESIDTQNGECGNFAGVVDKTVYDGDGRLLIPKGSNVVMRVQSRESDRVVLDLASIETNGEQFEAPSETEAISMASMLSAGVSSGGRVVIPENTLLTFRLAEPFQVAAQ